LVQAQQLARSPARFDLLVSDSQTLDWLVALSSGGAIRVKAFHRPVESIDFAGKEIFSLPVGPPLLSGQSSEGKCAGGFYLTSA